MKLKRNKIKSNKTHKYKKHTPTQKHCNKNVGNYASRIKD